MFRIEKNTLSTRSQEIIDNILVENPAIAELLEGTEKEEGLYRGLEKIAEEILDENPSARDFRNGIGNAENFHKLRWKDYAAIRLKDYIERAGEVYTDPNHSDSTIINQPLRQLWSAVRTGSSEGTEELFLDILFLFRQLSGKVRRKKPGFEKTLEWMDRYKYGLEDKIIAEREENKRRILSYIIEKIDTGEIKSASYNFREGSSPEEKMEEAMGWWEDHSFHLKMAIRHSSDLKKLMGDALSEEEFSIIKEAEDKGIPMFTNPYYLSLFNLDTKKRKRKSDQAIRDYIFANRELVDEFGQIRAWEKEDVVKPGEPNAAGWLLPDIDGLHRRYPHVAIYIPQTTGRSCGGLCISCQRMYDFQSGKFNFNMKQVKKQHWTDHLAKAMNYFRNDSQLRDILITGGDAFMSNNKTLETILDEVLEMARLKKEDNKSRKEGEKYAEMLRVRMGTRLPVYLPQRFNDELIEILSNFKKEASKLGIKQFVIQTHFVSPLEVTPEAKKAVQKLLKAGWLVDNQAVFTAAVARRGHAAKLRKVLNDIGIVTYYTFQVKGFMENKYNFAPVSRSIQEMVEEKVFGIPGEEQAKELLKAVRKPETLPVALKESREKHANPFFSTDRNVFNLPGVGKSLSFRVIGLANDGRRILEFKHDPNRHHSPIIDKMGNVIIIESKSVPEYLEQLDAYGEDTDEYQTLYGYTAGITDDRFPAYVYPSYDYEPTEIMTNLEV